MTGGQEAGSSSLPTPTKSKGIRPLDSFFLFTCETGVAQLAACHAQRREGREFESPHSDKIKRNPAIVLFFVFKACALFNKKSLTATPSGFWRRKRDSNPRASYAGQQISSLPRSTTPAFLRGKSIKSLF